MKPTDRDLAEMLRSLPPDLGQPPTRFDQIADTARRGRARRRAVAGAAAALATAAAIAVPTVLHQSGGSAEPAPSTDHASDSPSPSEPTLPPPADFLEHGTPTPGSATTIPLSEPRVSVHDGPAVIDLGPRPERANAVEVILECLSDGMVGTAGGGSSSCSDVDLSEDARTRSSWDVITLKKGQTQLRYPRATMRWRIVTRYVRRTVLPLGVNASGDTYGTDSGSARPDLIAVVNRHGVSGYVYATDLEAADPMPRTPEEAAALDPDRGPFVVPMYESDGVTKVGEWEFG